MVAADGHTYERAGAERWFARHGAVSMATGAALLFVYHSTQCHFNFKFARCYVSITASIQKIKLSLNVRWKAGYWNTDTFILVLHISST